MVGGIERERLANGVSFRDVAYVYLSWPDDVIGAKPATLTDHRCLLAGPGVPKKRGNGVIAGHIMDEPGDPPAATITMREVETMLS